MKKTIFFVVLAFAFVCLNLSGCNHNPNEETKVIYVTTIWKGAFPYPPKNPEPGWAYYNTTDKKSYIYDGEKWKEMEQDGSNIENIDNSIEVKNEEPKQNDTKTEKQNKTEQNETQQNETQQNETQQNETQQNETTQNESEQNETTQDEAEQDEAEQDETANNASETQDKQENEDIENTIDSGYENNEKDQAESIIEYKESDGSVVILRFENKILVSSVTVSSDGIKQNESIYYENGNEKSYSQYDENEIIQIKYEYDENGNRILEEEYEGGLIKRKRSRSLSEIDGNGVSIYDEYKEDFSYYDSGELKTHACYINYKQLYLYTFYENGKKELKVWRSEEDNECIFFEMYDENEKLKEKRIYYNKSGNWVGIYEKEIYSDTEYKIIIYDTYDFSFNFDSLFDLQEYSGDEYGNHAYTYDENGKLISHIVSPYSSPDYRTFEYYYYLEDSYKIDIYQSDKILKSQTYNEQNILISEWIYNYSDTRLNNIDVYTYYENGTTKTYLRYLIDANSEFVIDIEETYDINGNVLTRESSAGKETYSYDDNGIMEKKHWEVVYSGSSVVKGDYFYLYYPDGKTKRYIVYKNNDLEKYELYRDDYSNSPFYCFKKETGVTPDISYYWENYDRKIQLEIESNWNTIIHFAGFYESGRVKNLYKKTAGALGVLYSFDDKNHKVWTEDLWDISWLESTHAYSSKRTMTNDEAYELYRAEKDSIEIEDFFFTLEEYNQKHIN